MVTVAVCRPSHGGAYRRHEECLDRLRREEPAWLHFARPGCPCVDIARSMVAESVLMAKPVPEVCLWIDADMVFDPETCRAFVRQALEKDALIGAIYAQKRPGGIMNVSFPEEVKRLCFFEHEEAGLIQCDRIGFGLVAHPTSMLETIAEKCSLPRLRLAKGQTARNWFSIDPRWGDFYSDDYSFCTRATEAGYKIFADTRARVGHIGEYVYHVEDALDRIPRHRALEIVPPKDDGEKPEET